ncbi:hypothetical protein PFISCL1PPCAC_16918, partial [Pristionchus fissidentatus]
KQFIIDYGTISRNTTRFINIHSSSSLISLVVTLSRQLEPLLSLELSPTCKSSSSSSSYGSTLLICSSKAEKSVAVYLAAFLFRRVLPESSSSSSLPFLGLLLREDREVDEPSLPLSSSLSFFSSFFFSSVAGLLSSFSRYRSSSSLSILHSSSSVRRGSGVISREATLS